MKMDERQTELCDQNKTDFSDLRAVYVNCTLQHPDKPSHTALLMSASAEIMRRNGVVVDDIRATAHRIAYGVQPDMREHGWEHDDWPDLWQRIRAGGVVVTGNDRKAWSAGCRFDYENPEYRS